MHSLPHFFVLRAGEFDSEIPTVGAKVKVAGRAGHFIVLRVDKHRRVADLLRCDGMRVVDELVPFADIRADQVEDGPVTLVRARIPRGGRDSEPSNGGD